ncbi:hypothetical protein [Fodinicola acaciae]|uniref:hypothetical protein n=1 Tax=Fodinicola acaciae TaxID=2681555 RepID=UPI001651BDFF|nr:hypothetical protein [Fodinicola acaciae]
MSGKRRWFGRSTEKPTLVPTTVPATVDISGRPDVFAIIREADPSGVSGLGIVGWGVMFPDAKAVLRWTGQTTGVQQVSVYDSIFDIETVHGHDGATKIVFFPQPPSALGGDAGPTVTGDAATAKICDHRTSTANLSTSRVDVSS